MTELTQRPIKLLIAHDEPAVIEVYRSIFGHNGDAGKCDLDSMENLRARLFGENKSRSKEILQESEERYRAIVEVQTELVSRFLPDGTLTFVNHAYCRYFGESTESLVGHTFWHHVPLDDHERFKSYLASFEPESPVSTIEHRVFMSGGEVRWQQWTDRAIFDESGKLVEFQAVGRDVTDRKQAEDALRESEQRVRLKLESILSPEGEIGNLELSDIIDAQQIQSLMDDFYELAHIPVSIIDLKGKVLVGVGWQDICVKFHRTHPEACKHCMESDTQLSKCVSPGEFRLYKCKNNMWDIATPIVVGGQHLGNLLSGQFFFEDEPIDYELFRSQAGQFGFDEEEYIEALERVPRLSRKSVDTGMAFLIKLSRMLSLLSYGNIKLARSLTERATLTDLLRKSENRLNLALAASRMGVWEWDVRTDTVFWSPECHEIHGMEGFGGTLESFMNTVHPEDLARVMATARQALAEMTAFAEEFRIIRPGGEVRWISNLGRAEYDKDGRPLRLVGTIQDITERKRAEEALRNSEERYRLLFNSGNDAVFVHLSLSGELPGHFIEVNDIACKRLGYSREELLKMSPLDIDAPDSPPDVPWIMEQLATQGFAMWEGAHITKDGQRIPVEINNHCFDLDGMPIILATARDITERKQAEEERRRVEAQLRQAQKMEAIGTLAGGIAHDFNNILGAIMGFSELAVLDIQDGTALPLESLEQISKAARRARDLVAQILAFSRQSEQELKPTWIGIIVKEALKLLRASLPTTIEIVQDIESKGAVMADPTQIHQVLMNLCTNASHAMREKGGVLEVRLVDVEIDAGSIGIDPDLHEGAYLKLTVSDTGEGITPEIVERIFDPFFTTKGQGEGTGLGLSVVHGIVKAHGGAIKVRSEPGAGTTFSIFFPKIETNTEIASPAAKPLKSGKERILFVDDEPALAMAGKKILERLGYRVVTATGSSEALETFRSQPSDYGFDLVITDMTMPHMTGLELAGELNRIRPGVPIVMSTGYSEKITVEHAREHSFREILMKPLTVADLADAVRRALDE